MGVVDALSKGSEKGKSKGKAKRKSKSKGKLNNAESSNWQEGRKQVGKVTNMLMDGLGGSGSGCWMTAKTIRHLGIQKNQLVDLRSTALKDAGARALEGV